jgi:hypothetical protein
MVFHISRIFEDELKYAVVNRTPCKAILERLFIDDD